MAKQMVKPAAVAIKEASAPPPPRNQAVLKPKVIEIPQTITVRELARRMDITPVELIKTLMKSGILATINQTIDYDTAAIVAEDLGFQIHAERLPEPEPAEEVAPSEGASRPEVVEKPGWQFDLGEDPAALRPRPPVVTIMGHVDHGKTSLLDVIRQTNVVEGEAGGITQHIGAYQVEKQNKKITFIDTPGHAAFTAMRARGARVTDVAVLVVAADDGVMPQTVEALDHARAAGVPIVVALNKIDKENANPERVKRQLSQLGLTPDDWGGDTFVVPVSAKRRIGIDDLLDAILLVSDAANLRANPDRLAAGTVIESELDQRRGPVATVLVQTGTLRVGDIILVGKEYGHVRAMFDDKGNRVKSATPAMPVRVLGLPHVPTAGDTFEVVEDEKTARAITAERALAQPGPGPQQAVRAVSLEDVFAQMQAGKVKELNVILKVDVQGSLEPIAKSLEQLSTNELKVKLLRAGTGDISESDISLAIASQAIVIGFQVGTDPAARALAESQGVDVRHYDVIYKLTEDIDKALQGLLEPKYEDVTIGQAEVRQLFTLRKGKVAGLSVQQGVVARNARARVRRNGEIVGDSRIASLKRFTEDVKEVAAGFECGMLLEDFNDFEIGDRIECYRKEKVT